MADNCPKNPPTLAEALRDYRWASDLTDAEFARVEAGVFERKVPQGGFICRKGEAVEHWVGLIDGLVFPTARPRVMHAERTFWEKATAIHVFCLQERLRGDRFARHWHDVVRLDEAG